MITLKAALDNAHEVMDTIIGMETHDITRAWQDGERWVFLAEAGTREPTAAAFVLLDGLEDPVVNQVPDFNPDDATEVELS